MHSKLFDMQYIGIDMVEIARIERAIARWGEGFLHRYAQHLGRALLAADGLGSGLNADLVYPKDELAPGDFAWDFLKLHSEKIDNDKMGDSLGRHNIAKAIPFPRQAEIYPEMDIDINKLHDAAQTWGVGHADAVFEPLFAHSEPDFIGVIDSLYVYGSAGVHLQDPPRSSTYENRLTAIRWHDPDPAREHGRVQWFGVPLYFFENARGQWHMVQGEFEEAERNLDRLLNPR